MFPCLLTVIRDYNRGCDNPYEGLLVEGGTSQASTLKVVDQGDLGGIDSYCKLPALTPDQALQFLNSERCNKELPRSEMVAMLEPVSGSEGLFGGGFDEPTEGILGGPGRQVGHWCATA